MKSWQKAVRSAIVPGVVVIVLVCFGLREPPTKTTAAKKFTLTLAPFDANPSQKLPPRDLGWY